MPSSRCGRKRRQSGLGHEVGRSRTGLCARLCPARGGGPSVRHPPPEAAADGGYHRYCCCRCRDGRWAAGAVAPCQHMLLLSSGAAAAVVRFSIRRRLTFLAPATAMTGTGHCRRCCCYAAMAPTSSNWETAAASAEAAARSHPFRSRTTRPACWSSRPGRGRRSLASSASPEQMSRASQEGSSAASAGVVRPTHWTCCCRVLADVAPSTFSSSESHPPHPVE